MKTFKNFLKTIDIFGTTFSFRYKDRKRYQTISGGVIVILFIILALIVLIYYFIPFKDRKNYNIVYYTMNLASTEEINLFQSESNIALGVFCGKNSKEKYTPYDLLEMKSKYTSYLKKDDKRILFSTDLTTHKCTQEDFYNKYNNQFDYLNLSKYECLYIKNQTIQGIFTDQIFSYYDFAIQAKNDSVLPELDRFLFENDCKLEFYYTDFIIDLNNYKEPIKQYLNQAFIQLNPNLHIKRNIFFMNQYFTSDNYIMFVLSDEKKAEISPLYSRYEEYVLYRGLDRINHKTADYKLYSKIFIRADLKKTIIKRKYQKFTEFFADASSILLAILNILYFILGLINYFYAYHSLSKYLFFFKELEDDNNFNIFKKRKEIMELIFTIKNERNNVNLNNSSKKECYKNKKGSNILHSNDGNKKDIKIYSNIKNSNINNLIINKDESAVSLNLDKSRSHNRQKIFKTQYSNAHKAIEKISNTFSDNNRKSNRKILKESKIRNIKNKVKHLQRYNDSMDDKDGSRKIKNNFNIFEIVMTQIFFCCMTKNMKIKTDVNDCAYEIIYKKLDIITYVRNMLLFDIINKTILNDDKKDIINFFCRPVISTNNSQKNEFDDYYKRYKENNFDKFLKDFHILLSKPDKAHKENNLILVLEKHIEDFL